MNSDCASLLRAIRSSDLDAMRAVLAAGVDPNASLEGGYTPLVFAVVKGNIDALKLLIAAGVDLNIRDNHYTALMIAVGNRNDSAIQCLMVAGADPEIKSRSGQTALQIAICNDAFSSARLLVELGATIPREGLWLQMVFEAIKTDDDRVLCNILSAGNGRSNTFADVIERRIRCCDVGFLDRYAELGKVHAEQVAVRRMRDQATSLDTVSTCRRMTSGAV